MSEYGNLALLQVPQNMDGGCMKRGKTWNGLREAPNFMEQSERAMMRPDELKDQRTINLLVEKLDKRAFQDGYKAGVAETLGAEMAIAFIAVLVYLATKIW